MVKYKQKPDMELSFGKGLYKIEDLEERYELNLERQERVPLQERPLPEERVIRQVTSQRQAMPRMEEAKIQTLQLLGTEVIGSLFDRVEFLKQRIEEDTESLKIRKDLHEQMVQEIDLDIREKESFANRMTDIDEKRNFKLDISILRKEKRLENVQCWRDVVELRSELRELLEKHESETKIVNLFKDLNGGKGE